MPGENIIKPDFSDLKIKTSDFIKLLGYTEDKLPVQISSSLSEILSEAKSHVEIRGSYVIKNIVRIDPGKGMVELSETVFSPGKTISESLMGSEKLVCFLCTAGEEITKWASDTMDADPLKFYIIDMLGSLVVEYAVKNFQSDIEKAFIRDGMKMTNSYSPGYCGWKLAEQKKLFGLFPDNCCGIRLNDSSLMTPIKSISGIIGAGKEAEKRAYACEICDLSGCIYRDLNK